MWHLRTVPWYFSTLCCLCCCGGFISGFGKNYRKVAQPQTDEPISAEITPISNVDQPMSAEITPISNVNEPTSAEIIPISNMGEPTSAEIKPISNDMYLKTLDEYNQAITGKGLIVVDFTATWCGPCKEIGPKFVALKGKYKGVSLYKVDVDANSEAA